MSDELQAGDKIVRAGWLDIWDVVAVHNGTAWVHHPTRDGDVLVPTKGLTKFTPKIEVGKQYHDGGGATRPESPVTVADVNDEWAIGWYADGGPWSRRHSSRKNWNEITSCAAIED